MSEKVKFTVEESETGGCLNVARIDTDLDDFDDCRKCAHYNECPSDHVKASWLYCLVEQTQGCYSFMPIPKPRPENTDPEKCEWKEDALSGEWITQCGEKHEFIDDGPQENHYRFCPHCGKAILLLLLFALLGCAVDAPYDRDEVVCLNVANYIAGDNSELNTRRLALVAYESCIDERREAAQNTRDSLEAEYLEKLQTCNERAQEAYDSWMACAYPNRVELEEAAHDDQGGGPDGGHL
jgi:hypothetical protein